MHVNDIIMHVNVQFMFSLFGIYKAFCQLVIRYMCWKKEKIDRLYYKDNITMWVNIHEKITRF
jgi:hypothetical protein